MDSTLSSVLYIQTREYIQDQIEQFGYAGLSRGFGLVIASATALLTIWFIWQGWQIATGQSRNSMQGFIIRSVQVVMVMALAQGAALFGKDLVGSINGLKDMVSFYVTGSEYESPESMIDKVFTAMAALQDVLDIPIVQENVGSSIAGSGLNFITGMGQAIPALISGGLLLLNQIALNLCIVFAPLFIVCFLFDSTRPFFQAWVKFTVSTLFTLAVLTVIVTIAMKAILLASATMLAAEVASLHNLKLRDLATVSGGLGMLMTTLLLGGPALMTHFFAGAVASFGGYNQVGANAGGGGKPAAGPQDMVANAGTGANTQQNQQTADKNTASDNFFNRAPYGGSGSTPNQYLTAGYKGNAPTADVTAKQATANSATA